jgi:hypothetical protein
VKVKKRTLTLLDKDGKAIEKIPLALKWEEESSASFKGAIAYQDVGEPGKTTWTLSVPPAATEMGEVKIESQSGVIPGGTHPFELAATQKKNGTWSVGDLSADAAFPGDVHARRAWPVEITYPDKADKEWKKFVKTLLMIGIPILLLLLGVIAWLVLRPRFEKHVLVVIGQKNEKMAVHNIAQKIGLRGGTGPPETPGVLALAALGSRGKTRAQLAAVDGAKTSLYLNGKPIEGAKPELKDGDRVTYVKDGISYTYLYFAGDPPADLSKYLPALEVPKSAAAAGDDEIVIEF